MVDLNVSQYFTNWLLEFPKLLKYYNLLIYSVKNSLYNYFLRVGENNKNPQKKIELQILKISLQNSGFSIAILTFETYSTKTTEICAYICVKTAKLHIVQAIL